jgi:hypothetical protein
MFARLPGVETVLSTVKSNWFFISTNRQSFVLIQNQNSEFQLLLNRFSQLAGNG